MFINIIVGGALLLLGRKLFWLFVAGIGFMVAMNLVPMFFEAESEGMLLAIALIAGFVGALLAIFLQKLAIGIAGFLAGGYVLLAIANMLAVDLGGMQTIVYFIGGFIGSALVAGLFEWALILLSTLTGAFMIGEALDLTRPLSIIVPMAAFIVGVVIQSNMKGDMRKERRER